MSLISKPLFTTNNTDPLEAADAYEITGEQPINKLYDAARSSVVRTYDAIGGARGVGAAITQMVVLKQSGASGRQLLEAGMGMFGQSLAGVLDAAGGGILDKAGAMIGMDPSTIEKVKVAGRDVATTLMYGDPSDISSIARLGGVFGALTGNEEFSRIVNIGMEAAVWGAALSEATRYGMYDYYDDIYTYVPQDIYEQSVVFALPSVITSGSLDALKKAVAKLGGDKIIANYPGAVADFLKQFSLPTPTVGSSETYAIDLYDTLTLIDPMWCWYNRGAERIFDMSSVSTASEEGIRTLEHHPLIGAFCQIAPKYTELNVGSVMREQFPRIVTPA